MNSAYEELNFTQKNMLGVIQRSGGRIRYRDLCRHLHYSRMMSNEWNEAYAGLLSAGLTRESEEQSPKRRNTKIKIVELVATDSPSYQVRPRIQLKHEAEEKEYATAGWNAFINGIARKYWPRVGAPYAGRWYRLKEAWLSGWDDAKAFEDRSHGKPEKRGRFISRSIINL